jgi:O-antigen/teichoic acid export membrane protein
MMQKKFISNLLLVIALNLLVKPLAIFGIDATVQNKVGAEAYGLYFSLLNLSFLFNILMDVGINNFTTRNVSRYPHIASKYLGKLFSFRIVLFIIYALTTLTIGISLGYRDQSLYFLLILILNQWLVTLIAYIRSHFGGLQMFKTDALISVLDKLLLILFCGYLLLLQPKEPFFIEWFIGIQTACYALTLLISFFILLKHIGVPKFEFDWVFSFAILKKSYPYALLILLMMAYTRTDAVMLERMHPNGAHEAGVYAQGFRLLDAFFMFGMLFANLLLPLFSKLIKDQSSQLIPLLTTSRNLLVGGSVLLAFLCATYSESILGFIYTDNTIEAASCFKFLMWGFIGMSLSLIYGTLLTAKGDLRFLNQLSAIGIVLNVALNALLIPKYGATGSAVATLITQSMTAVVQTFYCHSKLQLGQHTVELLRHLGFGFVLTTLTLLFQDASYLWVVLLGGGGLGLFLFKLIDLKGILNSFRNVVAE